MEKIYGIYTGSVDMSNLNNMHEIEVWEKIEEIGQTIFWTNRNVVDNRFFSNNENFEALKELQYSVEYLVYYTRKFGVKFKHLPQAGEHIHKSEDFELWYNFWKNHVQSWTNDEFKEFYIRRKNGQDFSHLLPKTNWKGETVSQVDLSI